MSPRATTDAPATSAIDLLVQRLVAQAGLNKGHQRASGEFGSVLVTLVDGISQQVSSVSGARPRV